MLTVKAVRLNMENFTTLKRKYKNGRVPPLSNWLDSKYITSFSINFYGKFRIEQASVVLYEGYNIWEAVKVYNEA